MPDPTCFRHWFAERTPTAVLPPPDVDVTDGRGGSPTSHGGDDDWGDFVDSDDEGEIEELAEDPNLYPRGLCYPIRIGEFVAPRYRIVHKLGHGAFSTVWMAHDTVDDTDVALKIAMLGQSTANECNTRDKIMESITDTDRTHLLLHKDSFSLPSPHGQHQVLVFPLQGPNLREFRPKKPVATRMLFVVQLLQALKCLHSHGIVHGDLNSANLLYSLRPLGNRSISKKYQDIGRPRKMRLFTEQWKEGELVMPMEPHESIVGDSILLGDFGLAHEAGTSVSVSQKLQSPARYCAPERFHGADPSFSSDIWSYMCLLFELYTGAHLFPGPGYASVVSCITSTLGPLPASWKGYYYAGDSYSDKWYDQDWQLEPTMALRARIVRLRPEVSLKELESVITVLSWGLSYVPADRPTAEELLEDPSFKALIKIYTL